MFNKPFNLYPQQLLYVQQILNWSVKLIENTNAQDKQFTPSIIKRN